jgi:hypothetical protein
LLASTMVDLLAFCSSNQRRVIGYQTLFETLMSQPARQYVFSYRLIFIFQRLMDKDLSIVTPCFLATYTY